jgi:hypothetical protein
MNYKRNIETRSYNYCYRKRARNITYYVRVCVSVTLLSSTQRTCALIYSHLWPVWLYRIFPYYS